jgi:hypothetical protein
MAQLIDNLGTNNLLKNTSDHSLLSGVLKLKVLWLRLNMEKERFVQYSQEYTHKLIILFLNLEK